jgi:hypothetical protein
VIRSGWRNGGATKAMNKRMTNANFTITHPQVVHSNNHPPILVALTMISTSSIIC